MNASKPQGTLDILIVGAGFAGLYMLYRARKMGLSARIIEAASGVGGTWFHNRYPGARVDIQSMEYSFSFSDELQQEWRWSERYAGQPELQRYANHVADRFGLRDGIQLNTRVTGAAFDEHTNCWNAQTDDSTIWSARFLVLASGPLSAPNVPNFLGLDTFAGPVLHTANWPYEPVDFTGKRVGIIGTGSSGVQAIPIIAQQAAELTVFQRTAAYAVPARNAPLDPEFETRIKADYAGFRARNRRMVAGFNSEQPVGTKLAAELSEAEREAEMERRWQIGGFGLLSAFADVMRTASANDIVAEFVRRKIRETVKDPETARLLCPLQTIGCKRLSVDTDYYVTFNKPNVHLVDISTHPIDTINAEGLTTDRRQYTFDALVLATGFDAMTGTLMRLDLRGRNGLRIQDKWQAGPLNYLGLTIAGFPNLFNVAGPGSTSAFTNVIVSIEHHINWIADCITHLDRNGLATIEASESAEAAWVGHVNAVAERTLYLSCNSWYLGANIPGKSRMFMPLLGFPDYADRCEDVAVKGYEGFALA